MVYQIIAIFIMISFYGCYFFKMFLQKRQGIQTDQLGKGKQGFVKGIEIGTKAVTIVVPLAEVICIFRNVTVLPDWARILGAVIGTAGVAAFVVSVCTMKDSWRAGVSETEKTELVTTGIYQISRNPAFLGFDLMYMGILLMFFHWGLLLITLLGMLMLHLQIVNVEEDFLITAFGEDYLAYRRKVRRYLGRRRG